ncbi:hypothetical protein SAMD00019534_013310 [Acytostelium subglobosum LB1]|uniref:hypothetical protein n=1 Tax=Acytostelium subglobosum LB1 TaxID=1410327 RepID=UPI0006448E70|nr:hypothetical protein SAMD00019534_013310 [Acytostelium subglobosum LB1]GAM18156.1 hypothetical protein SAMD00019534_013310 [Acytostelium subglobosum LB1]|eukprot:XP_012758752.1 hypothetical protein SAMD00019534_013310 [Acytostelium subglobosum LB1]
MELFPLLLPVDTTFRDYKGFILFQGKQYPVEIGISSIRESIEDYLHHFFYELKDILDRIQPTRSSTSNNNNNDGYDKNQSMLQNNNSLPFEVYALVLNEIDQLGWGNVVEIDKSLSTFSISLRDAKRREVLMRFIIPNDYPTAPPTIRANLPSLLTPSTHHHNNNNNDNTTAAKGGSVTPSMGHSLRTSVAAVERQVEQLQPFFDAMEEIDRMTWVLEPEHPQRSDTARRIALGNNCSLSIDVNPLSPLTFPDCRFLGPERAVAPLRQKLNSNLSKWRPLDPSLLGNFQALLEMEFPVKQVSNISDFIIECSICYSHRLGGDGTIPDIICNNARCQKQFHHSCLFEWLRSLPNVNHSFDTLFGSCPYCSDPISVKGHLK